MRIRTVMLSGIMGAAFAYFLDPIQGTRRRTMARDRANSLLRRGTQSTGSSAQSLRDRVQGTITERVSRPHDNTNPDDPTLKDRIESELTGDPRFSREHVNFLVVDGMVDIHGQLPSQQEIDDLIARVKAIRDVKGVQSYLHLPGTPAPNKEASIEASR